MAAFPSSFRLRRAVVAAVVAGASLLLSLGPAGTTHPPGTFLKYPDAVDHWDPSRAQDYSPLYLTLARVAVPAAGIPGLRRLQTVMLAVACAAAALAVELEAGAVAGLLAGLLLASYRPLLVYAGVLEPEILITTLLALALYAAHGCRHDEGSGWRGAAWAAAAALCLALAAMARPQYVVLIPLWALWALRPAGEPGRWRPTVAALLAAALLLVPFAVHRLTRYGSLSVMNPGPVFYEGNGPQSPVGAWTPPRIVDRLTRTYTSGSDMAHVAYRQVAAAELGHPVGPAGANRYWAGLALDALRRRPARAVRLFLSKALLGLAPYELHDLINAHDLDRRLRRFLPWGFELIFVLTILAVPALPGRMTRLFPALSLAGLSWVVQIVFYPSARQRLPMALGLGVAAVILLASRPARLRSLALAVAAALALGAALTLFGAPVACANEAMASTLLGLPPPSTGERLAALLDGRAWRPSLRRTADAVALAGDAFEDGRPVAAASPLAAELRRASGPAWLRARAAWLAARSLDASGRYAAALEQARHAVALDGELLPARALLAALETPTCPEGLEHRLLIPGEDPLDAQLLLAEAAAPIHGPGCAGRVGHTVLAAFPELAGPSWGMPHGPAYDGSRGTAAPSPPSTPGTSIR